jgi:two-component system NarL family sensor kinase
VQTLLVAYQDALEARQGDQAALQRIATSLEATIRSLRDAIFDLYPYMLERMGLWAALRTLAEHQAARAGFAVTVEVDDELPAIEEQLVFTVCRELLANAAKHARATSVAVSARVEGQRLALTIRDNGRGFDTGSVMEGAAHGHIGLALTARRVEAAGGRIAIDSRPGRGTTVRASVPLVSVVRVEQRLPARAEFQRRRERRRLHRREAVQFEA